MSQAKVEKHKQEKYNRKNNTKQSRVKEYLGYAAAALVALALIIYLGYSVAIETGLYKPEETTTAYVSSITAEELASKLDSSGDSIGFYNKAKTEAQTQAAEKASNEESTTITEESSKKDK